MPICARLLCAALLFVVAGPSATYASNLVKTGSFEFPVVPIGGFTQFSNGQKAGPWKVVGASGNVAIINANFTFGGFTFPAKSGVQWMDLTGAATVRLASSRALPPRPGRLIRSAFSSVVAIIQAVRLEPRAPSECALTELRSAASHLTPSQAARPSSGANSRLSSRRPGQQLLWFSPMGTLPLIQTMGWTSLR